MSAQGRGQLRFRVRSGAFRNYDTQIREIIPKLLFVYNESEETSAGEMPTGIYHCMEGIFYHAYPDGIPWSYMNDPFFTEFMMTDHIPAVLAYKQRGFLKNGAFFTDVWCPPESDYITLARVRRIKKIPGTPNAGRAVLTRGSNLGFTGAMSEWTVDSVQVKWTQINIGPYFPNDLNPIITFN